MDILKRNFYQYNELKLLYHFDLNDFGNVQVVDNQLASIFEVLTKQQNVPVFDTLIILIDESDDTSTMKNYLWRSFLEAGTCRIGTLFR